jgi:hypothetical protein
MVIFPVYNYVFMEQNFRITGAAFGTIFRAMDTTSFLKRVYEKFSFLVSVLKLYFKFSSWETAKICEKKNYQRSYKKTNIFLRPRLATQSLWILGFLRITGLYCSVSFYNCKDVWRVVRSSIGKTSLWRKIRQSLENGRLSLRENPPDLLAFEHQNILCWCYKVNTWK